MSGCVEIGDRIRVTAEGTYNGGEPIEVGTFTGGQRDWEYETDESDTLTVEVMAKKKPDLLPVGTRVRVKYAAYFSKATGLTGTIVQHVHWDADAKGGDIHHYQVRLDESGGKWAGPTVYVRDLEEVKPEPKFKVGDRVRAVKDDPAGRFIKGSVHTVTGIRQHHWPEMAREGQHWLVKLAKRAGETPFFYENNFELAPDQTFKLKPGDKIRNTKTGRVGHVLDDRKVYDLSLTYLAAALTKVPAAAVEEYEEHHPNTYEIIEREGQPF